MRPLPLLFLVGLVSAVSLVAQVPEARPFGRTPDGREAHLYSLKGDKGFQVDVADYGGCVVRIMAPDRQGALADVVLGFPDVTRYPDQSPYFGALIGRVGNRIAGGRFTLDGRDYTLATNDQPGGLPCHLHGGRIGFDKVFWQAEPLTLAGRPALRLRHTSPDGDEGYPGTLQVEVTYSLTADGGLQIDYHAATDRRTPLNLTNHSYFNLRGEGRGTILGHELQVYADAYTPVDRGLIPTGEIAPVRGTPFDFTSPHAIGERIAANDQQLKFGLGYDHNFALTSGGSAQPVLAACLYEPDSGRVLEVLTTEPGLQFYSGNFLDGTLTGKSGQPYAYRSGLCLETQHFPDSIHHPNFPNAVLSPDKPYRSTTIYRFSTRAAQTAAQSGAQTRSP